MHTPGLLTRYAILGNPRFAGTEATGSAYVLTTNALRPRFPLGMPRSRMEHV
jgi:hypothetical protein